MIQFVTSPEFERSFDRGRRIRGWVHENKTALMFGAIAFAATAFWAYSRQRRTPYQLSVSGEFAGWAADAFYRVTNRKGAAWSNNLQTVPLKFGTVYRGFENPYFVYLMVDGVWGTVNSNDVEQITSGPDLYRTGIQSTSMYDPQNAYTDAYGAWVLPMSPEDWWESGS